MDFAYPSYAQQLCDVSAVIGEVDSEILLEYHCYAPDLTVNSLKNSVSGARSSQKAESEYPIERLADLFRTCSAMRRDDGLPHSPVHVDLLIQLDTYFVSLAGANLPSLLRRFAGQMCSIHLNGITEDGRQTTLPECRRCRGAEAEKWGAVLKLASSSGVRDFIIEHHSGSISCRDQEGDAIAMALKSGEYLSTLLEVPVRR
jgi:hypothetical protein